MGFFWTKLKLRNKFLVPMILLILASMGVSAFISYNSSKSALSDALQHEIQTVASSTAQMMDGWLKDRGLDLQNWSKQKVYLAAVQDSFLGRSARRAANTQLAELATGYNYYSNICLADQKGDIVSAANMDEVSMLNIVEEPFFKKVIEGQTFTYHLRKEKKSGAAQLIFAALVSGAEQTPGVIFSVIDIERIHDLFIDKIRVGNTGYAYIYEEDGRVIAHKNRSMELAYDLRSTDFFAQMKDQAQGLITNTVEGKAKWTAFAGLVSMNWAVAVTADTTEVLAPTSKLGQINLIVLVVAVLVAGAIIFFVSNSVVRPINEVVAGLADAAEGEGDLTKRLTVASRDEVGELAVQFNLFIAKVQNIIRDVAANAGELNQSSQELSELSGMLSSGADQTTARAQSVASASEQMSANMNLVASTMEEASTNVNMVASATEEMSVTISEIAQNTEKARSITSNAVGHAQTASGQVGELGTAAQEIGKVVETITDISEQDNLLALNATIAAARAGEAGQGFAVVANEIKELAQQTAKATGEIKRQVSAIQSSTKGTVVQIDNITEVVAKVDEIVSKIAAAVEEQSVTTREIAGNVAQASGGIGEINMSVGQSNTVAAEIAKEISEVTQAAGGMSNSSSQVNLNSEHLAKLAAQLDAMVRRFKI